MKALLRVALLALVFALPVQAEIPATLKVDGEALALNGQGIRTKWMMKIYHGGLYLPAKSSDATAIVAADEPMAIRLEMVSSLITSEKMKDATNEGFEFSTGGNMAPLQQPIDEFINVFEEEIKDGDIFDMAYIPGKGVEVYKNSALKKTIDAGLPFKQALFGIWLGDKPAQKALKQGMLGK
jgi:hypothetical protein